MPKKKLVIVESPAKARTIGRYLGRDYEVAASVGHVRDLPKKELGVAVDDGFEPTWVTIRGKGSVLTKLRERARGAEAVILATDPDREGEAIAYHVAEQLGWSPSRTGRFQRVTFREVTRPAVRAALERPGPIDMRKVEAQQARRILDRLVGYQISPFLWKPIRPGLSAGRVQTVALRLICEREAEIRSFVAEEYWSLTAHLRTDAVRFDAKLHRIDGEEFTLSTEADVQAVVGQVEDVPFVVGSVERKERRKHPFPPFTTSTLQQQASRRLGFSAKKTMSLAQRLYEGVAVGGRGTSGLITYMRTDSTRVASGAAAAARSWVEGEMGASYALSSPRLWGGKKQKGAQEAHEAIRPTDPGLHPSRVVGSLARDLAALYELIWLRFVAGQMTPAVYDTTTVDFDLEGRSDGRSYRFRASGSIMKFRGFTRLYDEVGGRTGRRGRRGRRSDDDAELPLLEEGATCDLESLEPEQHFTRPPPRYSEASLVKELEKRGIGRPSTYADIISKILDRGYVELEKRRFHATDLGEVVAKLLVRVFPGIFDIDFTSRMEDQLDRVEEGEVAWRSVLEDFYPHLRERLSRGREIGDDVVREILEAEGERCGACGRPMLVRWNRRGRFLGCSGYPECEETRSLDAPETPDGPLGVDEESGRPIHLKIGPYGPYLEVEQAPGASGKPRRVSVPDGTDPADISLEDARRLLSLPRTVGVDDQGREIVAGLGKYGPYVRREKSYADVSSVDELFEIDLPTAIERIEAKRRGGKRVLKDLGEHPDTGRTVLLLDGRYGPYVTDGKVNASVPKNADPMETRLEDAVDWIAEKRDGGGRSGRRRRGGGRGGRGGGGRRRGGGGGR